MSFKFYLNAMPVTAREKSVVVSYQRQSKVRSPPAPLVRFAHGFQAVHDPFRQQLEATSPLLAGLLTAS